jgi:hypothetical protein
MAFASSQKGMSALGLLVFIALAGFAINVAFKVGPHYAENLQIKRIITSIDRNQTDMTASDFYDYVAKGLQVNGIQDVDLKKALNVTAQDNKILAHLQYEQREPLIQNIDLVVKFDQEFSVGKP